MTHTIPLAWHSYRDARGTRHRLYIYIGAHEPLWHAYDVAHALGVPRHHLDTTGDFTLPGVEDDTEGPTEGELVPFISSSYVQALAAGQPAFLERMSWILSVIDAGREYRAMRSGRVLRTGDPRPVAQIIDADAETWSIQSAARLLDGDPTISCSREGLFEYLRRLQLLTKDINGAFVPTPASIDSGVLALNSIWVPKSKVAYNRIRITRKGLRYLHSQLGGTAHLTLDAAAPIALVEI